MDLYGDDGVDKARQEREAFARAFANTIDVGVPIDVFVKAIDPASVKMVTVNDLTGEVIAYRAEKFTMRIYWPKTLKAVGEVSVALAGATISWIGFVGLAITLERAFQSSGVVLTSTEACVFCAIYKYRNEHCYVCEEDLEELCKEVAQENGLQSVDSALIVDSVDILCRLGVIQLVDGKITLEDEWIYHGSWR